MTGTLEYAYNKVRKSKPFYNLTFKPFTSTQRCAEQRRDKNHNSASVLLSLHGIRSEWSACQASGVSSELWDNHNLESSSYSPGGRGEEGNEGDCRQPIFCRGSLLSSLPSSCPSKQVSWAGVWGRERTLVSERQLIASCPFTSMECKCKDHWVTDPSLWAMKLRKNRTTVIKKTINKKGEERDPLIHSIIVWMCSSSKAGLTGTSSSVEVVL